MSHVARLLFVIGLMFMGAAFIAWLADKGPGLGLGRLPGDVFIEKRHVRFYFPVTTSILVSLLVSLILFFSTRK